MDSIQQLAFSLDEPQTKRCAQCQAVKLVTEFHRSKWDTSGYRSQCKACRSRRSDPEGDAQRLVDRAKHSSLGLKLCPTCSEVKSVEAFSHNKRMADGYERNCKQCRSQRTDKVEYAKRLANRAIGIKRCARCGEEKPFAAFGKSVRSPDGHHYYCKACTKVLSAAKYAANRDKHRLRTTRWARENAEKTHAIYRKWRVSHMEVSRESGRRRRARKKNARAIPFTEAALQAKMDYWNNRCWICGEPADTIDHVKPLAKGGWHALANLRPCCLKCNSGKRDRWPYPLVRNIPRW